MVRRIMAAAVTVMCLAVVGSAAAADVTYVMKNGERQSGQLVYHKDLNLGLIQNGQERTFPIDQIAGIIYGGGNPSDNELSQLPTSDNPPELERHMLVLRDGRVLHGKVYHWEPDSVMFDTTSGRGTYNAGEVARLYLSGPPARRVFAGSGSSIERVAGNAGRGRGYGRGRQRGEDSAGNMGQPQATVRVQANQRWTDTGLTVQRGELIAFSPSGTVSFGKNMSAGPDGNKDLPPNNGYAIRDMPVAGLIGRVGNGAPFPIGSNQTPIRMSASGPLQLGVNDDDYRDNSGSFDVNIYRR